MCYVLTFLLIYAIMVSEIRSLYMNVSVAFKKSVLGLSALGIIVGSPLTYATSALPSGTRNNEINQNDLCSLNIGILIDRSNSIRNDDEKNPQYIRQSVADVATALQGTDSQIAVWSFGTKATGYQGKNIIIGDNGNNFDKEAAPIKLADYPGIGFTSMKTASGVSAIKNTVNSIPFSTDRLSAANSSLAEREVGWTNWQAAFVESNAGGSTPSKADIVFMITDGTPTLPRDFTEEPTRDPFQQDEVSRQAVTSGVSAANQVKNSAAKTRIVAIGVGDVTKTLEGVDNLKRISGGLSNSVEGEDYYLSANFANLGTELNKTIEQVCKEKPTPTPVPTPIPTTKPTPKPETKPAPVVAPVETKGAEKVAELPKTGPMEVISATSGLTLLTYALSMYIRSRSL